MQDNAKSSKLLSLFDTLEEDDKNIVIRMSESLVEKVDIPRFIGQHAKQHCKVLMLLV
jgi:hypothetical protein